MPLDPASPLGKPDCLLENSEREQDKLMMLGHGASPAAYRDDAHRCPAKVGDFQAYAAGGHDRRGPAEQGETVPLRSAYELERGETIDWSDDSASSWLSLSPREEQGHARSGDLANGPKQFVGEQEVQQARAMANCCDSSESALERYCKEHMKIQPHEIKPKALLRMLDLTVLFRIACTDGIIHCVDAEPGKVASVFGFAKIHVHNVAEFNTRIIDMIRNDDNGCWQSVRRSLLISPTAPCYELLRQVCYHGQLDRLPLTRHISYMSSCAAWRASSQG